MPNAEGRFGKPQGRQVLLHLELGEADVDAVDVGDDVAQEQDRQEPDVRLGSVRSKGESRERTPWGKLAMD